MLCHRATPVRSAQDAAENLSCAVAGQRVDELHVLGHLVPGELRRGGRPDGFRQRGVPVHPGLGDDVGPQAGRAVGAAHRADGGLADPGDARDEVLDLDGVDVGAGDDLDVVHPAEQPHQSLGVDARGVPGGEPLVRAEPVRRQTAPPYAGADPRSGDLQPSDLALRYGLVGVVDDAHPVRGRTRPRLYGWISSGPLARTACPISLVPQMFSNRGPRTRRSRSSSGRGSDSPATSASRSRPSRSVAWGRASSLA